MSDTTASAAEKTADRVEGVALGSLWGADRQSMADAWQRFSEYMSSRPALAFEAQMRFQAELARIWFGGEDAQLPDDSRFEDPEWSNNPIFRRVRQSYVAWSRALDEWLDKSDLEGIDRQRAEFLMDAAKDTFAPVNSPFTPEAIRKAMETGGESLVKGVQH